MSDPPVLVRQRVLDCKQRRVRCVRFNVDGAYCLTGGEDRRVRLWNPHTGLALSTYAGHAGTVVDACGACDSATLVSCGEDRSVLVWDVASGTALRRYRGHAGAVCAVRYNNTSTVVISGSVDNCVMVWDVTSRRLEPVQTLRDARDAVTSLCVDDYVIVAASADGHIRSYDVRTGRVTSDCVGWPVAHVSGTRDSQCLLASCADATIRLFDKDSGELLSTYSGHSVPDVSIECSVDIKDRHVVGGSVDGCVYYWDLITGEVKTKLTHSVGRPVHSLSHHPTANSLLSACDDSVVLWAAPDLDT